MENNCQLWVLNRGDLNSCVRSTPLQNGERLQINKCASLVYKCCRFLLPELQRRSTVLSKSRSPGKATQPRRSDHKRTSQWKLTGAVMNTSGFWTEHSPGFHSERNRLHSEHNHSTEWTHQAPWPTQLNSGSEHATARCRWTHQLQQWTQDSKATTMGLCSEHATTEWWTHQSLNTAGPRSEHVRAP